MTGFELLPAGAFVAGLPDDLRALCLHRRDPIGQEVRLLAVGDIGFSGRVADVAASAGICAPLSGAAPLLRTGAIVFANLETPLVPDPTREDLFAAPIVAASGLADAGFTLIHLANNHIYDYGPDGLLSTLRALRATGLTPLGSSEDCVAVSRPLRTDLGGLKIGWLGCGRTGRVQARTGPYYWELDRKELLKAIQNARDLVDVLIVSLHIGLMYLDYPDPEHRNLARQLQKEGADLVLMHHAHVLQGVEVSGTGQVVCYNLGNFLFDWQEGNVKAEVAVKEQNQGGVFLFDLDREGVCQAVLLPTWIDERCQVHWATGTRGEDILQRMVRISLELQGSYLRKFQEQRASRNAGHTWAVVCYHLQHKNWLALWEIVRRLRPRHLSLTLTWLSLVLRRQVAQRQRG